MNIDVHNHFYPKRFLAQLEKEGPSAGLTVEKDSWGRTILVQNGTRVVTITQAMSDISLRLEDMEKAGFDMQILSLSIPSVDILPLKVGEKLARVVNDEVSRICEEHPEHFMGFATLPFLDSDRAISELERSIDELKLHGVCMGSNINGINLDDPKFYPFYERISEYDLPIHIHPRAPVDKKTYKDYRLGPMIGFEMDLCVAVVRLIMGGVLEKFRNLKFVISHLGGAIPYLAQRIQNCYEAYPECQENISGPAMDYLKRIYYDTVSFYEPALMCAYAFAGADHLILGSDYPHVIGDIKEAVTSIDALNIPKAEKELICSGNILRLMHKDT